MAGISAFEEVDKSMCLLPKNRLQAGNAGNFKAYESTRLRSAFGTFKK